MSQSLSPIPPPLHLHQSTIPRCDSLTSFITSPFARILVVCPFAIHFTSSLPPRILVACAHTPPLHPYQKKKCHGGFNMPRVIHLTDYYKGN